ncbi:hypothetical protein ACB094_12G164200 [Castanea mollissima]
MQKTTINPGIKRIAVVTGANKGIGFEICRQLASNGIRVVLTARDVRRGNEAIEKLKAAGCSDVVFHQLDVMDPTTISSLADFIKTHLGKLDILVNNAGISGSIRNPEDQRKVSIDQFVDLIETDGVMLLGPNAIPLKEVIKQTYQTTEDCLRTNYYGAKQVSEALIPLLLLSNSGRIVNVSSALGQLKLISTENAKKELGDIDGLTEEKVDKVVEGFLEDVKENLIETKGWPVNISAYIVSKAALNAYTRVLARNTDMNHNSGVLTVEEGAKSPVMLALMPEGGSSGLFFDRMEVSTF